MILWAFQIDGYEVKDEAREKVDQVDKEAQTLVELESHPRTKTTATVSNCRELSSSLPET